MGSTEHEQPLSPSGDTGAEQPAEGSELTESPVLDETLPADRAGWEAWAEGSSDGPAAGDEEAQSGR